MDSIGVKLRHARVAKGMTASDIAMRTKIPKYAIEALESGDYASLPAPVFVRGFLRSYAQAVNIDGVLLVREFEQAIHAAGGGGAPGYAATRRAGTQTEIMPLAPIEGARFGAGLRGGYVLLLVLAAGMLIAAWLMVGNPRDDAPDSAAQSHPNGATHQLDGDSRYGDSDGVRP